MGVVSKPLAMSTDYRASVFIKSSTVLGIRKSKMPNEDFQRPYAKARLTASPIILGIIISGLIYGVSLWLFLWFVRSSDIASWQMPFWKCVLLVDIINVLRMYDKQIFSR